MERDIRVKDTDTEVNSGASVVERDNAEALAEVTREKLAHAVRKEEENRARFETADGLHRRSLLRIPELEREVAAWKKYDEVVALRIDVARLEVVRRAAKWGEVEAEAKAGELSCELEAATGRGDKLLVEKAAADETIGVCQAKLGGLVLEVSVA